MLGSTGFHYRVLAFNDKLQHLPLPGSESVRVRLRSQRAGLTAGSRIGRVFAGVRYV